MSHRISSTVQFAASNSNADACGLAKVTATLSYPWTATLATAYCTSDGTAVAPSNYLAASGALLFRPGDTTRSFYVPIMGNPTPDSAICFDVTLYQPSGPSPPTPAVIGDPATATVTIPYCPAVQFAACRYVVNESAGSVALTVNLTGASLNDVTVHYATCNGTAINGTDYTAVSGTLTIAAGDTAGSITVPVNTGAASSTVKNFTANLSCPSNATLGGCSTATVSIVGDSAAPPTVEFGERKSFVTGCSGIQRIPVELSYPWNSTITVNYATCNGTAVSPTDYSATSGTLVFPAGVKTRCIEVPVTTDYSGECPAEFSVSLSDPSTCGPTEPAVGCPGTTYVVLREVPTVQIEAGEPYLGLSGAFYWPAKFNLSAMTADGGVIIQQIEISWDITIEYPAIPGR